MSSQETDNSMPSHNNNNSNRKRSYDDDGDDDAANTINTTVSGREAKRQRTNDNEDDDVPMEHAPRSPGQEMSPSPPINPSNEETLDDVEVELDDLESISELEDIIGTSDLTNEDAVAESLGITEPATPPTPENIIESVERDFDDYDDNNDDYYRHIGSWSEPSSQQSLDDDLLEPQLSPQPQPAQPRHRPRPQRRSHLRTARMVRMSYYHLPEWNQQNCGKEYFRHALSDSSLDSDEEF